MDNLVCRVCGHEWLQRVQKPQKCPKCTSRNWDRREE